MIFPLISLTSLKGLIFDAEKLDEKDTHDLEYVRHDMRLGYIALPLCWK